ncbi:hypothetical protein [Methylocystis echinoides]|uniref:Uncharacterized protein n=1 Tax=Methylocystis echinoides TaxID=29468 RepID=A0A9W6GS28_9HYPH|nr:hypothetical protein LMG27198_10590 [Methylocystis echinoides]
MSCVVSTAPVETGEFAHEGVDAPRGFGDLAHGEMRLGGRGAGPQKQREMGQIAALEDGVENIGQ